MKLSILDQVPISTGKTAKEALEASLQLASLAEDFGYYRYWVAEHHNLPGLACPDPGTILGIIGAKTTKIRIGAGAVLLPHYKPFKVAETYNLLATLYPGRVDLGIGRAPGGSAETSIALSGNFLAQVKKMPEKLTEVIQFLTSSFPEEHLFHKVEPTPIPEQPPELWLLGTSEKSSVVAAEKGMNYAFGDFMSDLNGPEIVTNYRKQFTRNHPNKSPSTIIALTVICAETEEEANRLAMSTLFQKVKSVKGLKANGVPSLEEVAKYSFTQADLELIKNAKRQMIIGDPDQVKRAIIEKCRNYQADEIMIVTITHNYQARIKSYELIAQAFSEN